MKKILFVLLLPLLVSCGKENRTFSLKSIRLNGYKRTAAPSQRLYLLVFDETGQDPIAHTGFYPADLTLPATFSIHPRIPMTLYNTTYRVQLWGDSTGFISGCSVDMDKYKIIFPIDMEVESDSLQVSMAGSWE
ncbi:hypothetical protein [Chitinophaga sp.]|uniref:hypothetical protein n=1 Tax=Chitinophaga sp. TaxID=1869181 RepID=UPI00261AF27D|nr:hypothetical protein [uncultured Chitinophaga sp.]